MLAARKITNASFQQLRQSLKHCLVPQVFRDALNKERNETTNLAASQPKIAVGLKTKLMSWWRSLPRLNKQLATK
jgi:hypothetical protein